MLYALLAFPIIVISRHLYWLQSARDNRVFVIEHEMFFRLAIIPRYGAVPRRIGHSRYRIHRGRVNRRRRRYKSVYPGRETNEDSRPGDRVL